MGYVLAANTQTLYTHSNKLAW